jgi:uncharacterized protein
MTAAELAHASSLRVFIVPRWSGGPSSDWYPWLKQRLYAVGIKEVVAVDMPRPNEPILEQWVNHLHALLGDEATEIERTLLIGHSVGCQAVVRTLARLSEEHSVAGILCVAGWLTVDAPWPSMRPWLETPIDFVNARRAATRSVVMISDNDRFTSDVAANQRQWEETMGATVHVIPGAGHFNNSPQPAIWETFQHHFGALFVRST